MKPKSVLVVDDENVVINMMVFLLSEGPIKFEKIIVGESVDTALKAIRKIFAAHEEIDLLISDLRIGSGTGFDVVREVKEKFPNIKVIMMSGDATPKEGELAGMMGVDDFFTKPFNTPRFLNRIAELFSYN